MLEKAKIFFDEIAYFNFFYKDRNFLVVLMQMFWKCSQNVLEIQKKNPDALPDAGVREAIELPAVGERQVIQI